MVALGRGGVSYERGTPVASLHASLNIVYCECPTSFPDDLIAVSIQFEYDPDDLATKITKQLVHKSNS